MIERGDRVYNGVPTKLMNDVYDGLMLRDETIIKQKGWCIFSLYLARTCGVIEEVLNKEMEERNILIGKQTGELETITKELAQLKAVLKFKENEYLGCLQIGQRLIDNEKEIKELKEKLLKAEVLWLNCEDGWLIAEDRLQKAKEALRGYYEGNYDGDGIGIDEEFEGVWEHIITEREI